MVRLLPLMLMAIPIICYIACHGASSDHFATFIQSKASENVEIRVYAAQDMSKKFSEVKRIFALNNVDDSEAIAKECADASLVITDVGHLFSATIHRALEKHAPNARRVAYYDNPESYVPGGYSETAKAVMQAAQVVLFANANLASETLYSSPAVAIDLTAQKKIGLGYYPLAQAELIAEQRTNRQADERAKFLDACQIKDIKQKICVYFGGNNEEYFEKVFPAFLTILDEAAGSEDLSQHLFVLQQHPAAKKSNRDAQQLARLQHVKIIVSNVASDIAQIIADQALYYQTSMGPQFVLAHIPTSQVGHERYDDVLVRNNLIDSITTYQQLASTLTSSQMQNIPRELLLSGLGISSEWPKNLSELYRDN